MGEKKPWTLAEYGPGENGPGAEMQQGSTPQTTQSGQMVAGDLTGAALGVQGQKHISENAPQLRSDRELAAFYALRSLDVMDSVIRVMEAAIRSVAVHQRERYIERILSVRGESQKERVERQSGRSLSTEQAAKRQGVSAEAIRKRVANNLMIGYVAVGDERNRIRLPEWQFAGPREVHPWVREVLATYTANGWDLLDFLTTPLNGGVAGRELHGESLLDLLVHGEVEFVIEAAKRANPS